MASATTARLTAPLRQVLAAWSSRLRAGNVSHSVSILFLSTAFAQVTSLAVAPLLTRLYRPAEFGVLGVYVGLLTVLSAVATLRYEMAIPIARSDREASDLLALCGFILLATTLLVALAIFLIPTRVLSQVGLEALGPYRLLLPVGFVCLGAYGAVYAAATRDAAFLMIGRTRITQALTGPATQVAFGLAGSGAAGLIIGFIVSQSAGMLMLFRRVLKRCPPTAEAFSARRIGLVARRFRNFPLVSTWGVLAEAIGGTLALYLLISVFYSGSIAGFLYLTERVAGRPLKMIITSLVPVLFSEAARTAHVDPAQLRRRFLQVSSRHAGFAACWILSINIAAPWLFPRLFGPSWGAAIPYVRAVSVWYFCATVSRCVGPTLQVLERQVTNAIPQIAGPSLGAIAFVLCAREGLAAWQAILAYASCQALAFAFVYVAAFAAIEAVQPGRRRGAPAD